MKTAANRNKAVGSGDRISLRVRKARERHLANGGTLPGMTLRGEDGDEKEDGHMLVDERIKAKRSGGAAEGEKEFAKVERTRLNDVAMAPPTLLKQTLANKASSRVSTKKKDIPLSLAQQQAIEEEREKAIIRSVSSC